jgi:hypothetical protein
MLMSLTESDTLPRNLSVMCSLSSRSHFSMCLTVLTRGIVRKMSDTEDASLLLAPASISRATKILLALDDAAADQDDDDDMCILFDDM